MEYYDELLKTIEKWGAEPIEDEWLFESFRQNILVTISPPEAFKLIDGTIDVLTTQTDESTAIEVVETILALARHSDTTELPSKLVEDLPRMSKQFEAYGIYAKDKLKELFSFYRLPIE